MNLNLCETKLLELTIIDLLLNVYDELMLNYFCLNVIYNRIMSFFKSISIHWNKKTTFHF